MISGKARRVVLATAAVLALAWTPMASGAAGDPADPSSPGSPDLIGDAETGPQCPPRVISPPAGFTEPSGLPPTAPCGGSRLTNGSVVGVAGTNYIGVGTLGLQGAPRLAQWVKIPTALSVAVVPIHSIQYALGTAPASEPTNTTNVFHFYPQVWFVSADRKRVGEMPPFRVRTLAFGSIPVQVTVRILQPGRADGTVEPIKVSQGNPTTNIAGGFPGGNTSVVRDAHGKGRVLVRLSDLTVDGVPVDIGDHCQTREAGDIRLLGTGYLSRGGAGPPGTYNGAIGGLLKGTVDIAPFAGCRGASGDDVSPILTNAVSGSGNPVSINQTTASTACYPRYDTATCTKTLAPLPLPSSRPTTTQPPPGS